MTVVALRLSGPLQSWGSGSRFARRATEPAPTKSGVIGLVAAAKGIRRWEPIEELLGLRFGVRIDQPGQLNRDFQTAQRPEKARDGSITWKSLPLSARFYMAEATYLAILEGERSLVEGVDAAVRSPGFPLYLGRRSCPPAGPVALGVFGVSLDEALSMHPWLASLHYQRSCRERSMRLETVRDALPGETAAETIHDGPVSFDPNRRRYAWRPIVRGSVVIENPHGVATPTFEHDPMFPLGYRDVPD